ncbi:unnamed protein product [Haemonchus placei]|uniref:Ovule protein n=1 Tax=Haemonchus placei TaxID=6290 RepID=A0A0N4WY34_HAEPC|nr:unnamed protein product [Haemonchus placei]
MTLYKSEYNILSVVYNLYNSYKSGNVCRPFSFHIRQSNVEHAITPRERSDPSRSNSVCRRDHHRVTDRLTHPHAWGYPIRCPSRHHRPTDRSSLRQ